MNHILIENLAVLVCSIVDFLFGIDYLKPRKVCEFRLLSTTCTEK